MTEKFKNVLSLCSGSFFLLFFILFNYLAHDESYFSLSILFSGNLYYFFTNPVSVCQLIVYIITAAGIFMSIRIFQTVCINKKNSHLLIVINLILAAAAIIFLIAAIWIFLTTAFKGIG